MKYYKLTVLKDLPGFTAGEVFDHLSEIAIAGEYGSIKRNGKDIAGLIRIAIKNPDFVRTEIDINAALEVRCSKCGRTKMFFCNKFDHEEDDGVRYEYATISLVCAHCGHTHDYYTFQTHSEVFSW